MLALVLLLAGGVSSAAAAAQPAAPNAPSTSHDLWTIRSKDRKGFTMLTAALDFFPHPTLLYLKYTSDKGEGNAYHLFDGHKESVSFDWVTWLICPEALVMRHWAGFFDTNPIFASGMILYNAATFFSHTFITQGVIFRLTHKDTPVNHLVEHVLYSVTIFTWAHNALTLFLMVSLFWITPAFLIDFGFYLHFFVGLLWAVNGVLDIFGVGAASQLKKAFNEAVMRHDHDHSYVTRRLTGSN
jgi:hypothetical protein